MIKKILKFSLFFIIISLIIGFVISKNISSSKEVSVFIPGEYFDNENLIPEFRSWFKDSSIRFSNFDSNEVALSMIKSGEKYDVAVLSDYAIQQLREKELIEKINWDLIKDKEGNILVEEVNGKRDFSKIFSKKFLKTVEIYNNLVSKKIPDFNILNYSIPYFWGDVGILYNKNKVNKNDLEKYGWSIFQQTDKYSIAFYDSSRDGFMIALKDLGKSLNPLLNNEDEEKNKENLKNIDNAYNWLKKAKENGEVDFITDEIFDDLSNQTYDMVFCYSGDASAIINPDDNEPPLDFLDFYVPETGTNLFIDGAVIPKGSNKEHAYKFLSFILNNEMAEINEEAVRYISPLKTVYEKQIIRGEKIKKEYNNQAILSIYNLEINEKLELFLYEEKMKKILDEKWLLFRTEN